MKITKITLGLLEDGAPRTLEVEPFEEGLTILPTEGIAPPSVVAEAIRETIAGTTRRPADTPIPFVRVALRAADLAIEVADDAVQGLRMLTEGVDGAIPRIMEAPLGGNEEEDADLEALLLRIANAAQSDSIEELRPALASLEQGDAPATESELAFVEAQRRWTQLAREVRAIDDRMTASVVPDWLWVATGFGGVGVLLTAIVFLYPETRIYLIPALLVLSVIGFALYGWRSAKELSIRGRLQEERRQVRARREAAKAEASNLRSELEAAGRDPDELLVRLLGRTLQVPRILTDRAPEEIQPDGQVLLLLNAETEHPRRKTFASPKGAQ